MKKIISFAVTLCMILSLFASFATTVSADTADNLEVIYKNADIYEINLVFSEAILDKADLEPYKAAITLKKNGIEVSDNNITFASESSVATKWPDATTPAQTLIIRPAGGLEIDVPYTLTISKDILKNADSTKTMAEDFEWKFKIREIFRDDFESGSTEKWTPTANTTATIETEDVLGGTKSLSVSSKGAWTYMSINEAYMPADSSEYSIFYNYKAKAGTTYMSFYTDTLYGDANAFQTNSYVSANMKLALWENGSNVIGSGKEASRGKGRVTLKDGIIRKYEGLADGRYIREFEYVGTSLKSGKFTLAFRNADIRVIIDDILVTKAEDVLPELSVSYKNADISEINLIFSDVMPAAADISPYVTLKKNGVPVDSSTITFANETDVSSKCPDATATAKTFVVRPAGGLEVGAVYTLTIGDGLKNSANTLAFNDDYVWNFKVEEIFSDDFEIGSTEKWNPGNNTEATIVTEGVLGGTKSLSVKAKAGYIGMSPKEEYLPKDSSEYSIFYNYKRKAGTVHLNFYTDSNLYGDSNALFTSTSTGNMSIRLCEGGSSVSGSNTTVSLGKGRVTLKDGIVRKYEGRDDGRYVREYEFGTALKSGTFSLSFDAKDAEVIIDDILVTKCIDIDSLYATDMEATLDESNAQASMYIVNGTKAQEDVVVIYALYKGENEFVKAHKCDKLSLEAGEGAVFALPEVATEGATKIKVFVWNNLTDLTPYDFCQQFPTN